MFFVPGFILDHFSDRKSIFRYRKLIFLRNFTNIFLINKSIFYIKIDFWIKKNLETLEKASKNWEKTQT